MELNNFHSIPEFGLSMIESILFGTEENSLSKHGKELVNDIESLSRDAISYAEIKKQESVTMVIKISNNLRSSDLVRSLRSVIQNTVSDNGLEMNELSPSELSGILSVESTENEDYMGFLDLSKTLSDDSSNSGYLSPIPGLFSAFCMEINEKKNEETNANDAAVSLLQLESKNKDKNAIFSPLVTNTVNANHTTLTEPNRVSTPVFLNESRLEAPTIDPKLLTPVQSGTMEVKENKNNQDSQTRSYQPKQQRINPNQIIPETGPLTSSPRMIVESNQLASAILAKTVKECVIDARYRRSEKNQNFTGDGLAEGLEYTMDGFPRLSACRKMTGEYCTFCSMYISWRNGKAKDPRKACMNIVDGKPFAYQNREQRKAMRKNKQKLTTERNIRKSGITENSKQPNIST